MGMSASQARYLQLTARKSDLEFQAQQICQKRLSLAERTEQIATKYSNQINDRHLYYNAPYTLETGIDENGNATQLVHFGESSSTQKRLDYYDITNPIDDSTQPGLGYRIVDSNGKIVVPAIPEGEDPDKYVVDASIVANSSDGSNSYTNACNYLEDKLRNAEWTLQKINTNTTKVTWSDAYVATESSIKNILDNYSSVDAESSNIEFAPYRLVNSDGKIVAAEVPEGADPKDYVIDENLAVDESDETSYQTAFDYVKNKLSGSEYTLQQRNYVWSDTDFYTNTYIDDLLYEDNDSAADAEYTRDTQTIQSQDKALEMRLDQITTEQKSIETEMESVKKVIDKNIESSFKTFG